MYRLLDNEAQVEQYAVECCSIASKQQLTIGPEQRTLNLNMHSWDVMLLQPHGLLIEVQGEGHKSKADTRQNNDDITIADRVGIDHALAEAAKAHGFSVLWAHVGLERGRAARWRIGLKAALAHVKAGLPPTLIIC